jgi:hypothetical protein
MTKRSDYFPFKGGMNIVDPALTIPPGELIDGYNYETVTRGGYRRIGGFERYDGHHTASESIYHIASFLAGVNEPSVGATITGNSSLATGVILAVVLESGSWGGGDAAGYFVVHVESGTFTSNEDVSVYFPDAFSSGFNSGFF